jgi:hypothetical protein
MKIFEIERFLHTILTKGTFEECIPKFKILKIGVSGDLRGPLHP